MWIWRSTQTGTAYSGSAKDAKCDDGKMEFGRVVARLEVGLINALKSSGEGACGANQTLQDRLIKEIRLRNINSMEAAQAFLPAFMLT